MRNPVTLISDMTEILVQIIFGWPAVITSILLSVVQA